VTDPFRLLKADREKARSNGDPWADLCVVATISPDGQPRSRVLVLRSLDDQLALFFNDSSPKSAEFSQTESLSVLLYLHVPKVQYRLTAAFTEVDPNVVAQNWKLRPPVPRKLDWLYETRPQSSSVPSRETLLDALDRIPESTTAPATARGYILVPTEIERLDLDQPNGVHDRRCYTRSGDEWSEAVLIP
ncbi:uncharacterized protein METZ01_LOCUS10217, partial [marine metagenome]